MSIDRKVFEQMVSDALLDDSALIVTVLDTELNIRYASPATRARSTVIERAMAESGSEGLMDPVSLVDLIHPDDLETAISGLATRSADEDGKRAESRNSTAVVRLKVDDAWAHLEVNGVWSPPIEGEMFLVIVARDVTEKVSFDRALQLVAGGADLDVVLTHIHEGLVAQLGSVEMTIIEWSDDPLVVFASEMAGVADAATPLEAVVDRGDRANSTGVLEATTPGWWRLAVPFGTDGARGVVVLEGGGIRPMPAWLQAANQRFLDLISVAVASHRSMHQLRIQARTDSLTGLLNRQGFEEALTALSPVGHSMLWLDLDRFKAVNDRYGHLVGDALLVETAERIRACIRDGDLVVRVGGDEFVILLPNSGLTAARGLGQRLVSRFAEPFDIDGHLIDLGLSIGCASSTSDERDSLSQRADRMLYEAKARGGSQLVVEV